MSVVVLVISLAVPVSATSSDVELSAQDKWDNYFTLSDFRFNKLGTSDLVSWYHNNAKTSAPYDQCNYLLTCKSSLKYGTAQMDDTYEIFVFPKSVSTLTFDSENMRFELPVGTEYYSASFWCRSYIEKADFDIKNSNSLKVTTTDKKYTFFPGHYEDQRVLLLRNDFEIIDKKTNSSLSDGFSKKSPIPYTVSYTPALSLNMANYVYVPSKGGANADENGNVKQENNLLTLELSLTDSFKSFMNTQNLGSDYSNCSYSVVCFLSSEQLTLDVNTSTFMNSKAVLYAITDTEYYSSVKGDTYDSSNRSRGSYIDKGKSPIINIPRDGSIKVVFDISNINFEGHKLDKNQALYVNVVGLFAQSYTSNTNGIIVSPLTNKTAFQNINKCIDTATLKANLHLPGTGSDRDTSSDDRGFTTDGDKGQSGHGVTSDREFSSSSHISAGAVNENKQDVVYYSVYSYSEPFRYEEYPEYQPREYTDLKTGNMLNLSDSKFNDLLTISPEKRTDYRTIDDVPKKTETITDSSGNTITINKPTTKYGDTYVDVDIFNDNLSDRNLSDGFGDIDFGGIDDIFDTTGGYFKFLTAGLSILPDWFYATFMAWFVIYLAIALVKLVIPG